MGAIAMALAAVGGLTSTTHEAPSSLDKRASNEDAWTALLVVRSEDVKRTQVAVPVVS